LSVRKIRNSTIGNPIPEDVLEDAIIDLYS